VEAWTERQPGRPAKRPAIHGNCGANPAGDQNVWIQCYRLAEQQKNVRAMIEILRYLTDRRDGKAYVAENPAERQKARFLTARQPLASCDSGIGAPWPSEGLP
jgi:hypothetical protein